MENKQTNNQDAKFEFAGVKGWENEPGVECGAATGGSSVQ